MSYIGTAFSDNTNLFTGTITTTGAGPTIDVTGFATALLQLTGNTFSGIITLERSLDNVNWYPCLVTEMNALNQKTQIDALGIYAVRTEAQYLRYNITNITGSLTLVIDGGTSVVSPVDKIAWAMDESNNSPLNVRLQSQNSGIKQDLSGAFILSDAPQPVTVIQQATGGTTVIDTTGYQTIHLTTNATFAATGGVQFSNDGVVFTANAPSMTGGGVYSTAIAANTNYIIPVYGRFARIVATTAGQYTYYLRNTASQLVGQNLAAIGGTVVSPATAQLGMNIVQIGATTAVTGGLAGTIGVGGASAVGVAPTYNPLIAGSIDPGGLGRRLFSDATGRLFVNPYSLAVTVPSSLAGVVLTATAGGSLPPVVSAGYNNQVAPSVQDTSQFEGQSQTELLAQILQEMKIMNQQLYELPKVLMTALNGASNAVPIQTAQLGDEPGLFRNDASIFGQQQ